MFNYNINWTKLVKENLPVFLHQAFRLTWIIALIAPVKKIYVDFLALRDEFIYKVRFNGQVIYLERILNDKFDFTLRRIYIEDGPAHSFFVYRRTELKPDPYTYRIWKSTTAFAAGEFAVHANKVYKALVPNTNQAPSSNPSSWLFVKNLTFLWHATEFGITYNFIVNVPTALSLSEPGIKAQVNYYKLGGRTYIIKYF